MEWSDEAIVLATAAHGETGVILTVLTPEHGRYNGMATGGRREAGLLQPGNRVQATWHARLVDHLGKLTVEALDPVVVRWMDQSEVLAIIASATAMAAACLPDRQPMPGVYAGLLALLALDDPALWGPVYVKWEIGLLRALGYGLDLTQCAVTGETQGLCFVSPRTGRAVGEAAARPYKEKLLRLPGFLTGAGSWDNADLADGLRLTGHFLERHVLGHNYGRTEGLSFFPPARERLADLYTGGRAKKGVD
jgi:DNA repair protein RecO (recombination protein O)